jgi:hypothetical protein
MTRTRFVVGWLPGLLLAVIGRAAAEGPTLLRWKLSEGDRFHYRIEEQARLGGKPDGVTETLRMETTWTVGKTEDGVSGVTIRIDQIRFAAEGVVLGDPVKVEYDSSAGKAEGQGAKALSEVFGAMIGADIQMKMGPLGGASDPGFPKELADLLDSNTARELTGFFGETVSSTGIKRALALVPVGLPKDVATVGTAWTNAFAFDPHGGLSLACNCASAYRDQEVLDGSAVHKIEIKAEETVVRRRKDRQISHQRAATGTAYFDSSMGRLRRCSLSTKEFAGFRDVTTSATLIDRR